MHEAILNPTTASEQAESLTAAALQAQAWYGEPFLHPDEDPVDVLAPGTARRLALDDALAEIEAGNTRPSARWKVRYGLMLGLERVLASPQPATASGTELRRHQIDALAGMLAELISANQRAAEENGNGNGHAIAELEPDTEDDEDEDDDDLVDDDEIDDEDEPGYHGADPGASRRYRFRHPTARARPSPRPVSSRHRGTSGS